MQKSSQQPTRPPICDTTTRGTPVPNEDASITAGRNGPLTSDNWRLFEKPAHFNREQISERGVHARGSSAFSPSSFVPGVSASLYPIECCSLGCDRMPTRIAIA